MKTWAVYMCPYTFAINRVIEYKESEFKPVLAITASGEFHVLVEAENECEAKVKALEEQIKKRLKELNKIIADKERVAKDSVVSLMSMRVEHNALINKLYQITRQGELTIYNTGKRICFERYVNGKQVTGEVSACAPLQDIVQALLDARDIYDEDDEY